MNASAPLSRAQRPPEVAERVYRLGTKWVNFYLVADGAEFTLVDAGYPGYFMQVERAVAALGVDLDAIRAVLVTHHHVDHAGTAERLRSITDTRVLCGERDSPKVGGERPSHPPRGFYRQVWRPSMIAYLAHTVAKGGARYHPVAGLEQLSEDRALQLPGRPWVIQTPGHMAGHYSVVLAERGVLFSGDAMVNFDYASGRRGPALHVSTRTDGRRSTRSPGSSQSKPR
jgi:glyoxylase-like metal-dependent hydrolase (beta-lactamase superfamily II)